MSDKPTQIKIAPLNEHVKSMEILTEHTISGKLFPNNQNKN
jgi:hypothetical protein